MKKTVIDMNCGIYSTELTIRDYGHKIIVTVPYIKWVDNSGTLDFRKVRVTKQSEKEAVRKMADKGELCLDDGTDFDDLI